VPDSQRGLKLGQQHVGLAGVHGADRDQGGGRPLEPPDAPGEDVVRVDLTTDVAGQGPGVPQRRFGDQPEVAFRTLPVHASTVSPTSPGREVIRVGITS
jgi:hypothetical protein